MTITFICPGLDHSQNIFTLLFSFATQKALWDALFIYMYFFLFHILVKLKNYDFEHDYCKSLKIELDNFGT